MALNVEVECTLCSVLKAFLEPCSAIEAHKSQFLSIFRSSRLLKHALESKLCENTFKKVSYQTPLLTCIVFFLSGICISVRADRLTV